MMRTVIILALAAIFSCFSIKNAKAVENSALVRASIIEKIAEFIEWPSLTAEQFTICAFDNSSLLPALEMYYANSYFRNKPIRLINFNNFKVLLGCQIIYLDESETKHLENIIKIIEGYPILIITEKEDNVSQGAHVGFFVDDNRLHLEVNRTALLKSRLKASYHLLGVARIVK